MKRLFLIFILLLFFVNCKKPGTYVVDESPKNTKIYLSAICESVDSTNVKECIQFSDNTQKSVSIAGKPENYTTAVYAGKNVTWKKGKKSKLKIKIISVNMKSRNGNIQILDSVKFTGRKGIATGKVKKKDSNVPDGSNEYYTITFEIEGITYTIDPVIQYHRR